MLRLGFAVLLAGVVACSSDPDDEFATECEPRTIRECDCDDGSKATQVCDEETAKWGECDCPLPAHPGQPGGSCEADSDCNEAEAPACVAQICVLPDWVGPGESCNDAPDQRCIAGYFCNNENCISEGVGSGD